MKKIVHLSDLHFGRVDPALLGPLAEAVRAVGPSVVVVSGDLTQRARTQQFAEARKFLDQLPKPQVVVPGNHDVPLWDFFSRFARPLDKYRRYISEDVEPVHEDDELVVAGVNTARSLTTKYGRINERQIGKLKGLLCNYAGHVTKVVVTHHPFDLPAGGDEREIVGRARLAMEALAGCGVDLLLAGHLHVGHTGHTAERYKIAGHSALVVQAGTATSTRGRGESNSFNLVRVRHPHIQVERRLWRPESKTFAPGPAETFMHTPGGWQRLSDEVAAGIAFDEGAGLQSTSPAG
ncbi:MAG TPA: metallophosphoesterase [Pyrinomonadaceae bacterium]|jgi:3',5'-cyclic AMP phosphodiesterase CpdA|nr:metallophosphoesterase [Pyrinomonadaceae bacterium]